MRYSSVAAIWCDLLCMRLRQLVWQWSGVGQSIWVVSPDTAPTRPLKRHVCAALLDIGKVFIMQVACIMHLLTMVAAGACMMTGP